MNNYPWTKLVSELMPFAEKSAGSCRIDVADIRTIVQMNQTRLDAIAALEMLENYLLQVDDMEEDSYQITKTRSIIERLQDA